MAIRSQPVTKTLKVGDAAPDFTLRTANGIEWHLADFRGEKNVVLAFVPYAFSSVCSAQLPSYESELERFKDFDTEVVSISLDSTYALNAWAKSMHTSFPLLSDFYPKRKVVDLYALRHQPAIPTPALISIAHAAITLYL